MDSQQEYNTSTHRKCGRHGVMPIDQFYPIKQKTRHGKPTVAYRCARCSKSKRSAQYHARKALGIKQDRSWVKENPERARAINQKCYEKNKTEYLAQARGRRQSLRLEILRHYSGGEPKCALCQESHNEFLVLDHTDQGGTKHRGTVGNGDKFYKWVAKNWPENLRVLCHNCNFKERLHVSQLLNKRTHLVDRHINGIQLTYKQNVKLKCLEHYSHGSLVCNCCGHSDVDALSIDHINGGGRLHRRSTGEGSAFYAWLYRNKFPSGYRVLCLNCNFSLGLRGSCPHGTLTRRESDLFDSFRVQDVVEPLHESPSQIFKHLSQSLFEDSLPQTNMGLNYLDNTFPHRFDAQTSNNLSFRQALADDDTLRKVVRYITDSGREPTRKLVLRNSQFVCKAPAHFFPSAATAIFREYAVGADVFDPFAGWGGRALGAVCAGVGRLVTTDLQERSIVGVQRIARDFQGLSDCQIEAVHSDFKKFAENTDQKFDFIFTSPPFASTEDYGVGNQNVADWTIQVLVPLVQTSRTLLRSGGKVAIHGQDQKALPILSMIIGAFTAGGFQVERKLKYGKKIGQAVVVFTTR